MTAVPLDLDFSLRGLSGRVLVDVRAAAGPASSGRDRLADAPVLGSGTAGLPVCTARIEYDGVGYAAAMGWVQLVRSTDSQRPDVYEPDPLALFAEVDTPYAFFGIAPTLFDAPQRDLDQDLTWAARSFRCVSPDAVVSRAALPVLAFTWGFEIRSGSVTLEPPAALDVARWADHVPALRAAHPGWTFRA